MSQEDLLGLARRRSERVRVVQRLNEMDEIGYEYLGHRKPRTFMVNVRRANSQSQFYGRIRGVYTWEQRSKSSAPWERRSSDPSLGLLVIDGASAVEPTWPSLSQEQAAAGEILRRVAPAKPEMQLLKFVGEQKDAPSIFKAANYLPRNPKEAAGAFLNYVFGVKPTVSDVMTLANTAYDSELIMRKYIAHEKQALRRNGKFEHSSSSDEGYRNVAVTPFGYKHSFGFAGVSGTVRGNGPLAATNGIRLFTRLHVSSSSSVSTRAFGTWEYFIPKPAELEDRLGGYRQKAEVLLGGSLSEGDIYELTPWSWLADWFLDIGGLIRYQESVRDNNLVAVRCGTSTYSQKILTANVSEGRLEGTSTSGNYRPISFVATGTSALWRSTRHTRNAASPYSIGPTWPLAGQQAAILAALGISQRR